MKARLERYLNRLLMLQKFKELSGNTPPKGRSSPLLTGLMRFLIRHIDNAPVILANAKLRKTFDIAKYPALINVKGSNLTISSVNGLQNQSNRNFINPLYLGAFSVLGKDVASYFLATFNPYFSFNSWAIFINSFPWSLLSFMPFHAI